MAWPNTREREILERYKSTVTPGGVARLHNWCAITSSLGDLEGREDRQGVPPHHFWVGVTIALAAGVVLLLQASATGVPDALAPAELAQSDRRHQPERVTSATPVARDGAPRHPSGRRDPAAPPVASPSSHPSSTPARSPSEPKTSSPKQGTTIRRRPKPAHLSEASSDTLGAEMALVSELRQALSRGALGRTLALVSEHRRRFPDGHMLEEVSVIELAALCEAGPVSVWKRARAEFRRRYPGSPLEAHARDCPLGTAESTEPDLPVAW